MRTRLLAVAVAIVLAAGACSDGGGDSNDVASLDGASNVSDSDSKDKEGDAEKTPADRENAALEFARCMREHGIDMPDPEVDGAGRSRMRVQGRGGPEADEKMEKAQEACRPIMEAAAPEISDEQRKKMQDAMVAFARCMREHGIDMPDPNPDGGGIVIQRRGAPDGSRPDPESDEFQAAERECRKHTEALDRELGLRRSRG